MSVCLHPTALPAPKSRGSRSHRTAPAHPPTARANGHGPSHILPTGCRKLSVLDDPELLSAEFFQQVPVVPREDDVVIADGLRQEVARVGGLQLQDHLRAA